MKRNISRLRCLFAAVLAMWCLFAACALAAELNKTAEAPVLQLEENLIAVTPTPEATALVIEGNISAALPTPEPPRNVVVMGFTQMRLTSEGFNVLITNPEENEGLFNLCYTMFLKETGEELFTTGLLAPGEACTELTFSRIPDPGEYETQIKVQPYRISDHSPTNSALLEVLLIVEE